MRKVYKLHYEDRFGSFWEGRFFSLCDKQLKQFFEIPVEVEAIWVIADSEPFEESYLMHYHNSYMVRIETGQLTQECKQVAIEVCDALFKFKDGKAYVGIQYEEIRE